MNHPPTALNWASSHIRDPEGQQMSDTTFPKLAESWEPTRATLHVYARAVGAIPRALATPHPRWWHVSLNVGPDGLVTDEIDLPSGGTFHVRMDLREHRVVIEANTAGPVNVFSMLDGLTGTQLADGLIAAVAALGLEGDYDRSKFESDETRGYDPESAETYLDAVLEVVDVFEAHRREIGGEVSPVQLWPHNFDVAFEWFGTRVETYGDEEHRSQLNLGFYPAGRAYFYSNPWPFEQELVGQPLPEGAEWYTEGWEGTILYYDELAGSPGGPDRLARYARAVFDIASPTLMA